MQESGEGFRSERAQYEVLDILTSWFSFVPPIPLPGATQGISLSPTAGGSNDLILQRDKKVVEKIMGLPGLEVGTTFLNTSVGKMCASFTLTFATGDPTTKPDGNLWDLCEDSQRMLAYHPLLSSIHCVQNETTSLYMFNFGSQATTLWKLAVYNATAVMYVCCLPSEWKEGQIALDLVQASIPFCTLQERVTLLSAPPEKLPGVIIPMHLSDHVFDQQDAEFYTDQCEKLMMVWRSRAALLKGGFVCRIALQYISMSEAVQGPLGVQDDPAHMLIVKDSSGVEYIDDKLTQSKLDVLCGLYKTFTGKYPLTHSSFLSSHSLTI